MQIVSSAKNVVINNGDVVKKETQRKEMPLTRSNGKLNVVVHEREMGNSHFDAQI